MCWERKLWKIDVSGSMIASNTRIRQLTIWKMSAHKVTVERWTGNAKAHSALCSFYAHHLVFTPLLILFQGDTEEQLASYQSSGNVAFKCLHYKHQTGSFPPAVWLRLNEAHFSTQFNLPLCGGQDKKSNWKGSGVLITVAQIMLHSTPAVASGRKPRKINCVSEMWSDCAPLSYQFSRWCWLSKCLH